MKDYAQHCHAVQIYEDRKVYSVQLSTSLLQSDVTQ